MATFNGQAIADGLSSLYGTMSNLRVALSAKGISVSNVPISEYANLIRGYYVAPSEPAPEQTPPEPNEMQWGPLELEDFKIPSDRIWWDYYGSSSPGPVQFREPWKSKAPTGEYDSNAISYLGAVLAVGSPYQATIVDMDNRLGGMLYLFRQGIHDPYINYEAELNYRSPRFDYQGPAPKQKRVVELQLGGTDYFDATDYAVERQWGGLEHDHFVVYFPDRLQARTVVVEGYSTYYDGRSNVELIFIQGETPQSTGYDYSSEILTATSEHPFVTEPPTFSIPAGAPGFRFIVTYDKAPLNSRIFVRVMLVS